MRSVTHPRHSTNTCPTGPEQVRSTVPGHGLEAFVLNLPVVFHASRRYGCVPEGVSVLRIVVVRLLHGTLWVTVVCVFT